MRVLMVAFEAAPYAKTGGLADVVGSLPAALRQFGHEVVVLIPRYRNVLLQRPSPDYHSLPIWLGGTRFDTALYADDSEEGVRFYFLDCPPLYDREGYYGDAKGDFVDNDVRFAVLCRAALEVARRIFPPKILHCHDWQAGLAPVYLRSTFYRDPTFAGIKTLFTIHNLGYHGLFAPTVLSDLGLDPAVFHLNGVEFFGKVSLIKGGLAFSDRLNTVSPTYAQEIQTPEFGFALDGLLRARANVLSGILNGVDYRHWNPETDASIPANYSAADLAGKRICKQALLEEFGLPPDAVRRPLIGIVSRFTRQKGVDLIRDIAAQIAGEDLYLVALGEGEPECEEMFQGLAWAYPAKIAVRVGFDNGLAHRIEAGSDMFLMPSRYEPCGLNQMYSLKYGTVPIVRATGGLNDTIEEGETGFKFAGYSGDALLGAIRTACSAYADPDRWTAIMRCGMGEDFSWPVSAARYSDLYRQLAA